MIRLGLFEVSESEPRNGIRQRVASAAIPRDHGWITRLRMCQRQCPATQPAILNEAVELCLVALGETRAALHVGKLADIEIAATGIISWSPAKEDVRGALNHPLANDHPPPLVLGGTLSPEIGRQNRWARLLHLKEQRITGIKTLEQQYPTGQADAADPDSLPSDINHPIA